MGDEAREGFATAAQDDAEPQPPPSKKRRGKEEDLQRVAQIVMVLSAMVEMRAGKEPTIAEKALAAEARERLARLCEEVRPKDLFSSEAVRIMVEDLGMNRSRDLAFRPPKMSIAERVQHTKKKMEESRDHAASAHTSLPHSTSFGPSSESNGSQRLIANKSSSMVSAAGSFPNNSTVHIPALASSTSSMKQAPTSKSQTVLVKSSLGKDSLSVAMPSVEAINQRLDARINGPTYFTLVRPTAATNYLMEKASASGTSTSAALATQSLDSNSQGSHDAKAIQVSHQMMKTYDTKGPVVQGTQVNMAIGNQPSQGLTFVHVPSFISNHNEIAKSVMGIVQPKVPDCSNLPLPSTEYMTIPLNCQACKIIITDVESLLVCDGCETGIHLKCLQFHGTKTIPKADWYCPKCLSDNDGDQFPPKYGRVTRNIPAVTITSSGGGIILVEKNGEIPEAKFNYQKSMENDNLSSSSVFQVPNVDGEIPGEGMYSGTSINYFEEKSGLAFATPRAQIGISDGETAGVKLPATEATKPASDSHSSSFCKVPEQRSLLTSQIQTSVSESMPDIKEQSGCLFSNQKRETVVEIACQSQLSSDLQTIKETNVPIRAEFLDNLMQKNSTTITEDFKDIPKSPEAFTNHVIEVSIEGEHGSQMMCGQIHGNESDSGNFLLVDDLHKLDWVGDILEVVENRTYYKSCRINGCIIQLHDKIIVSTNNQNFYPAKLLSLWEDNKVLSKLAIVNEYFLPGNLPEGVNQPSTPETDEVYASDRRNTILASSIYGLCDILPEDKFREETDKRTLISDKGDVLHSVFMCKWIFDESKGIFQSSDQFL